MRFMNRWDIENAVDRWQDHPVLGPASRTIESLANAADANSDGWCYWPKPCRSAAKLIELIEGDGTWEYFQGEREDATLAKLTKALAPVKAFRTRSGINFTIYDGK